MRRTNITQWNDYITTIIGTFFGGLRACAPDSPTINVLPAITLCEKNQGTRFNQFKTPRNRKHPIETGDHLIAWYCHFMFHNMMMHCSYALTADPKAKTDIKQNNGLGKTETEQEYVTRFSDKTLKNWALAITPDIDCFTIQEGPVKQEHKDLFKKAIGDHLPGWTLRGGTEFGLWILVREKYKYYVIDDKLSSKLKRLRLDSRCLTLAGPTEKVSNIHVPHIKAEKYYKPIVRLIIEDMIEQIDLQQSNEMLLEMQHIVSDNEHIKNSGTLLVSVSGITEFTLRYGDKTISHKILGDFNLKLSKRQQLDKEVFSAIEEELHKRGFSQKKCRINWVFNTTVKNAKSGINWVFNTTVKNAKKCIAGLCIGIGGGGMTLLTDFAAVDEAGAVATVFGRNRAVGFFSDKSAALLESQAADYFKTFVKIKNCA